MCDKTQFKYCPSTIDKCLVKCINTLENMSDKYRKVVSCCCGHGKYPITIVMENSEGTHWDLLTGIIIPRKRRFYRKDSKGYYYIPEISKPKN